MVLEEAKDAWKAIKEQVNKAYKTVQLQTIIYSKFIEKILFICYLILK